VGPPTQMAVFTMSAVQQQTTKEAKAA
jgi:hypothetical protein